MKILVVDDEKIIRTSLQRIFCKKFQTKAAENGLEGLQIAREFRPDVVLLDWIMPELSGRDFCKSELVKELQPKIIVMSAYQNDTEGIDWKSLGVSAFVEKPFENAQSLVDLVEETVYGTN